MNYQKEIHDYLEAHQQEMLDVLGKLIAIRSVQGDAQENAPFGTEPASALQYMLDLCQEYGFQIDDADHYAGSADLNQKTPELGILAHLDVVPEGDGWTYDPYQLTYDRESDKLYGRGTSDDKGPAVAALFAMKAVKDLQIPMKSGVRLIFGTNEENGSEDLEYYMQHRTLPPMVFTPDGDYPVITLEKGMMRLKLSAEFQDEHILEFHAGDVINAVPSKASALIQGVPESEMQKYLDRFSGIQFRIQADGDAVRISAEGRSAHASTPEQGCNALTAMAELLADLTGNPVLNILTSCCPYGEFNGESYGINAHDALSGDLTLVCSVIDIRNGKFTAYHDIRFPVCCDSQKMIEKIREKIAPIQLEVVLCDEPHHTDENSPFVRTLLNIYEHVTGLKGECLAIGGGTYVHHIEGGVAFGATFPDTDVHMHGADEFIKLSHLMLDAEMIALAMTELCGA